MTVNHLSLDRWDRMEPSERENAAQRLAGELPTGFVFRGIQPFRLGDQHHEVAIFDRDEASFALIPGGSVRLGYDANRKWEPTPEERESFAMAAESYGTTLSINEHLSTVTLRPRAVEIRPFLMETTAREFGWMPIPADHPVVLEILASVQAMGRRVGKTVQSSRGDAITRICRSDDGTLTAEQSLPMTHAELSERLKCDGFRLPTSDEWEYACGCGSDTLFRWGDHAPCDHYPIQASAEQAAWGRQRRLAKGKNDFPKDGFAVTWDLHRRANAFGLHFPWDAYKWELTSDPTLSRGADGGHTACGGAGYFVGWLPLATAYFEEESCKHDPAEPISPEFARARRVFPL